MSIKLIFFLELMFQIESISRINLSKKELIWPTFLILTVKDYIMFFFLLMDKGFYLLKINLSNDICGRD